MSHDEESLMLLTRYLLGELPEDERVRLEKRFFEEAEFLEDLQAVERDLIDSYVRGELTGGDRERFEQRFLTSPALRRRVLLADTLARTLERQRSADQPAVPQPIAAAWRVDQVLRRWWPVLVATTIVIVAICAFLIWRATDPPSAPPEITEEQAPAPPAPTPTPPALSPEVPPAPAPRSQPAVATFILEPGLRGERGKMLVIPATVKTVRLVLNLRLKGFASYTAVLRSSPESKPIWQSPPLHPQTGRGASRLFVPVPSHLLGGRNFLQVSGVTGDGAAQVIDDFYFEASKP